MFLKLASQTGSEPYERKNIFPILTNLTGFIKIQQGLKGHNVVLFMGNYDGFLPGVEVFGYHQSGLGKAVPCEATAALMALVVCGNQVPLQATALTVKHKNLSRFVHKQMPHFPGCFRNLMEKMSGVKD